MNIMNIFIITVLSVHWVRDLIIDIWMPISCIMFGFFMGISL